MACVCVPAPVQVSSSRLSPPCQLARALPPCEGNSLVSCAARQAQEGVGPAGGGGSLLPWMFGCSQTEVTTATVQQSLTWITSRCFQLETPFFFPTMRVFSWAHQKLVSLFLSLSPFLYYSLRKTAVQFLRHDFDAKLLRNDEQERNSDRNPHEDKERSLRDALRAAGERTGQVRCFFFLIFSESWNHIRFTLMHVSGKAC